jgi:hypothetical protein
MRGMPPIHSNRVGARGVSLIRRILTSPSPGVRSAVSKEA